MLVTLNDLHDVNTGAEKGGKSAEIPVRLSLVDAPVELFDPLVDSVWINGAESAGPLTGRTANRASVFQA